MARPKSRSNICNVFQMSFTEEPHLVADTFVGICVPRGRAVPPPDPSLSQEQSSLTTHTSRPVTEILP